MLLAALELNFRLLPRILSEVSASQKNLLKFMKNPPPPENTKIANNLVEGITKILIKVKSVQDEMNIGQRSPFSPKLNWYIQ